MQAHSQGLSSPPVLALFIRLTFGETQSSSFTFCSDPKCEPLIYITKAKLQNHLKDYSFHLYIQAVTHQKYRILQYYNSIQEGDLLLLVSALIKIYPLWEDI